MSDPTQLYLDLLKKSLMNLLYAEPDRIVMANGKPTPLHLARQDGSEWPLNGPMHSMIGMKRLNNIQHCLQDVLQNNIPGDVIETGVWQGGASIFMQAVLKVHKATSRRLWVADSFNWIPPPNPEKYPQDAASDLHTYRYLAVPLEKVQQNFLRYDLLDMNVRFLKGLFEETLPTAPIDQLALIRLDGDLYQSTMEGLMYLYPKLSSGGYILIDDYGAIPNCKQAVDDYRAQHQITAPIIQVDWTGVYWQKP